MKVRDIGEFGLIDLISKKPYNKDILVGIGDDAAVLKTKGLQVLTTDCIVEGDHFRREWFTAEQIGMKAIEINVSDVAAMGADPKYALISLALPCDLEVSFVEELYKGMWKSCKRQGLEIIGGNMTHCPCIVISVMLMGEVSEKKLSLRSDAKPGDLLLVSGHLGYGRAGLRLFQETIDGFENVKKRYLQPRAHRKESSNIAPYVHAMIDISDGLAPEITHICDESNCGAVIFKDKIPIDEDVRQVAKVLGEDAYDYALFGGEDFVLLYTVSADNIKKVNGFLIGEITHDKEVKLRSENKAIILPEKGYDHFSNPISN